MRPSRAALAASAGAILLLLALGPARGAPPPVDAVTTEQLQKQVADLDAELARFAGATTPTAQSQAMQRHWGMMQDHMRYMRRMPGMGAGNCSNWQMMDPSLMGPGMGGCAMMDHGMGIGMGMGMGPEMMGWGMPAGVTPAAYRQQMTAHMQTMRGQMAAIAAEQDPARRQTLIREHYDTMYRDMQTMRGMGWMWAQGAAGALPDPDSRGAKLVLTYCSQCHAAPPPSLHTAQEWDAVTARMRAHIRDRSEAPGSVVKVPSATELDAIAGYLENHGRSSRP